MQSKQSSKPPLIPIKTGDSEFDKIPVALHGQNEKGPDAKKITETAIPNVALLESNIIPYITPLPGYTENHKFIYEYPEVTGARMRPPILGSTEVARVSPASYEVESWNVMERLRGAPPIEYPRQWIAPLPYMY